MSSLGRKWFQSDGISGYVGKRKLAGVRRIPRRKVKRVRKFENRVRKAMEDLMLQKNNLQIASSTRLSASAGQQAYGVVAVQNSGADLNTIFTKIGTSVGGVPAITSKAMKFSVDNWYLQLMMKNNANANVVVDAYLITPRNDMQQSVSSLFASGMTDQSAAGADVNWGTTPYQCQSVVQNFKILSKTRYLLAPGATEILEYRDSKRKMIDYERVLASTGSSIAVATFKGISKLLFCIIRGEPTNDQTNKDASHVSSTLAAVDFIATETYFYSYSINNATKTDVTGSFGGVTTANSVLIDTGATVTPAAS